MTGGHGCMSEEGEAKEEAKSIVVYVVDGVDSPQDRLEPGARGTTSEIEGDEAAVRESRRRRIWKTRLHYYYKSMNSDEEHLKNPPPYLPQDQWEYCVKRFGSEEFKKISERNSKNRLSEKRCTHTTGNLSFTEFEDKMVKQNKGVKPHADAIWLAEHTHENDDGELEWADPIRSKKYMYDELKEVITTNGDTMTQKEVLLEALKPRSGYFRGKGTTLRGYTKGQHQILQQKEMQKQQQIIQEQEQRIKELEEMREQDKKELEMIRERDKKEMLEQQQHAMDVFKLQMMEMFARRVE
ncbi:hypothetical protein RIF29_01979 [Crotalaria pallida]|uniref:Uncharacterized protein n=1 Tax=Crotalaria pallida TaxID=3830 RepID=A0AAN9IY38_CROPI